MSIPVTQQNVYPTTTSQSSVQAIQTVVYSRSTQLVVGTYVSSSASSYLTSSTNLATITTQTTTKQNVLGLVLETLQPGYAQVVSSTIPSLASVEINWTTDNPLTLYVFNASEYSTFASSSGATTSPNIASKTNTGNGTLTFTAPSTGTYYLVVFNPNTGVSGTTQESDLFSTSGTATFNVETTTQSTQTTTYTATTYIYSTLTTTSASTTSIPETITTTTTQYATQTGDATTTASCRLTLWEWIAGSKCA